MRGEVGPVADHMKLLNVGGAIRNGESDRILILNFYFVHFEGKSRQRTLYIPPVGMAKRAAHVNFTCDGGMSGELVAQVGAPENIRIELIHAERDVGQVVVA